MGLDRYAQEDREALCQHNEERYDWWLALRLCRIMVRPKMPQAKEDRQEEQAIGKSSS
jgi:hypothetical protein